MTTISAALRELSWLADFQSKLTFLQVTHFCQDSDFHGLSCKKTTDSTVSGLSPKSMAIMAGSKLCLIMAAKPTMFSLKISLGFLVQCWLSIHIIVTWVFPAMHDGNLLGIFVRLFGKYLENKHRGKGKGFSSTSGSEALRKATSKLLGLVGGPPFSSSLLRFGSNCTSRLTVKPRSCKVRQNVQNLV